MASDRTGLWVVAIVLVGGIPSGLADDRADIDALLAKAKTTKGPQRDALLAEAAKEVRTEYETLGKKLRTATNRSGEAFEEAMIAYFNLRLQYVEIQVLQRGKPYIDRMGFLLAGQPDRKALLALAGEGAKLLHQTQRDLAREISDARQDADKTKMVYLVPELEDVQAKLAYLAGRVYYLAAVVLPKPSSGQKASPQRDRLLQQAVRNLERFVQEPDFGVRAYAALQQGRAYRELGQFDKAQRALAQAVADPNGKDVLVEALFEAARNRIEQAVATANEKNVDTAQAPFAQAEEAIQDFARRTPKVHPPLGVDIKTLVLSHALYRQWARVLRAAGRDAQAAAQEKKSQQAFLTFLHTYKDPVVQAAVGRLFRETFRGKDVDISKLDPGIVLLLGTMETENASALQGSQSLAELSEDERAAVLAHLQQAEVMFRLVRDAQHPDAIRTLPDALWKLGVVYVKRNDHFQAAEQFRRLAEQFPQHEQAQPAALNAVNIAAEGKRLLLEQGKEIPRRYREELVKSIRLMLRHWPKDKEAARYRFDLAWECENLSETASDEQCAAWRDEAIRQYEQVPADSRYYDEARFCALELRYQAILAGPTEEAKPEAVRTLRDDMMRFSREMRTAWENQTDPTKQNDLGRRGSTSEFHGEVLAYDLLGEKDQALSRIEALPNRWPKTRILRRCREFAIRSRLTRGEVPQALRQFKAFQQTYGASQAQDLMQDIVEKLREAIPALAGRAGTQERRKQFREAYLTFARQLYDARIGSAAGREHYALTLLYADALVQGETPAQAQKALRLYEQLAEEDAAKRKDRQAKIREEFAGWIAEARAAGSIERLQAMRTKLADILARSGLASWSNPHREQVQYIWSALARAKTAEETEALLPLVRRALVRTLEQAEQYLLRRVRIDAGVRIGLARCHEQLKQYPRAMEEFRRLVGGLDPQQTPQLYWEAQRGYCESFFEAYRNDPAKLRALVVRIRQLRKEKPDLGGLRFHGTIGRIQADAEQIVRRTEGS